MRHSTRGVTVSRRNAEPTRRPTYKYVKTSLFQETRDYRENKKNNKKIKKHLRRCRTSRRRVYIIILYELRAWNDDLTRA